MTPCPRCRAPVVEHARFCSECGTWVVHAVAGMGAGYSSMPAPPQSPGFAPMQPVELAGTLPASAAMLAALSHREPATLDDLPAPSQTFREAAPPSQMSIRRPAGPTQVRTLDTGRPPPPDATPTREEDTSWVPPKGPPHEKLKTVVDDRPPVTPSRSLGRTPRPLGAFLVSYQYEPLGTFWPLAVGANMVGRSGGGRPDIDVGISDTTVSSEQAVIEVDPRGLTVEDRGSRNGTSVNGRAISAGVRVPVSHGDRVTFGSFETIVVLVPYPAGV